MHMRTVHASTEDPTHPYLRTTQRLAGMGRGVATRCGRESHHRVIQATHAASPHPDREEEPPHAVASGTRL